MGMRLIAHVAAASVPETQAVLVAEATLPVVEVLRPATQSLQPPNPGRATLCQVEVINVTGMECEDEDSTCAICQCLPVNPVMLRSCSHAMCEDCTSAFVAHSMTENESPCCPICRVEMAL
ncbi:hypothetical protein JG688_00015491 [Phytophthora aleatoria]|uniref:RING-type domain-containing protein n=1 Tax=Phytophthora aleatoria TaxID=2496075 RepID=A0A8J5IZE2_9STRA|nr:hypothetical protein JG688_00015491 [Phytophthora aleatoria]